MVAAVIIARNRADADPVFQAFEKIQKNAQSACFRSNAYLRNGALYLRSERNSIPVRKEKYGKRNPFARGRFRYGTARGKTPRRFRADGAFRREIRRL